MSREQGSLGLLAKMKNTVEKACCRQKFIVKKKILKCTYNKARTMICMKRNVLAFLLNLAPTLNLRASLLLNFENQPPKELPQFSTPFLGTFWQHFGLQIRGYSGTYQIILQHNKILRDSWNTLLSIIRWEPGNKNTILGLNLYVSITSDTSLKCALKK